MKPKLITLRSVSLLVIAVAVFGLMAYWLSNGAPLPMISVPSTEGKAAFVSSRDGKPALYMQSAGQVTATGSPDAVKITDAVAPDDRIAWSPNGQRLAFVTMQSGIPQIAVTDAAAGKKIQPLTNTSSAKQAPVFSSKGAKIYYLDAGKIAETDADTGAGETLVPNHELKELSKAKAAVDMFSTGGITRFVVSPDESRIAFTLKLEHGEALVLFEMESEAIAVLGGAAEGILPAFLPDGTLIAVLKKAAPVKARNGDELIALQMPALVYDSQHADNVPPVLELGASTDKDILVLFDKQVKPVNGVPLGFAPADIAVAGFGERILLACNQGNLAGLYLLNFADPKGNKRLYDKPVSRVTVSPNGLTALFESEKSLYRVGIDADTPPVAITSGQGENTAPSFSPAFSEAAKVAPAPAIHP